MDAVEYLRQKNRMCKEHFRSKWACEACGMYNGIAGCAETQNNYPEKAVEIVRRWAEAHPAEGGVVLTAMERRFVRIYIDKGYLWAARDKDGELNLYTREPVRGGVVFVNTSPTVNGTRAVTGVAFHGITWENSPVCLPKLLEK